MFLFREKNGEGQQSLHPIKGDQTQPKGCRLSTSFLLHPRNIHKVPCQVMVGKLFSFSNGSFLGDMSVSGGVFVLVLCIFLETPLGCWKPN